MALKPIQILINAKDSASGVFDKLQSKIAAVGIAVAGYFGIRAFAGIVQGAADLEQGMSRVQAATGATAEEMVALRKAAEDVGSSGMFTSVQAAGALENLAKAGLSATDAIAALPAVTSLAAAGDVDLATSAEFVTKAVMGMGLEFSEAGRVADVLAKGANATNTSVTGLAQALSYAAPVAQSLGLSLEQTVAIIGKFADAGIDASRAGTALNSILSQFSNPASKFRSELAAAGITTTDFGQALEQLAASGPRGQSAVLAVGQEAGPALRALLNQGIGSLSELRAALEGSAGSAAATAKVMQSNLNGAISGLGAAWDTVKNTLGTPVLPVLKDGVEQLAGALRGAVADGTVAKFGEAIASAFRSAIEWVKQFVGSVDFTQVAADMRSFADRTKEIFDQISLYATNAGNSVKLAYGVMSGGVNVVLTAVYGIGVAFAEVASKIMTGIALLREGLAKVTFGGLSAGFKEAAEDARVSAGAFGASADALRSKATEALGAVADGAQLARDGWDGFTGEVDKTQKAAATSSKAMESMAEQMRLVRHETAAAKAEAQKKSAVDEAAAAAVSQLREEYRDLVSSGDLQGAAVKLGEINKALRATPGAAGDAAKAAKATADAIAAAFASVGIKTKAELAEAAATAKTNFELIKKSGQATAEGLQQAFTQYAEASIAANGGVATEAIKSEAAMRGLKVEADETGKAIVSAMDKASGSMSNFGRASGKAASDHRNAGNEIIKTAEDIARANARATNQGTVTQGQTDEANRRMRENNKRFGRPGEGSTQKGDENSYDPGRDLYGRAGTDQPRNGNGQTQAEFQRMERLAGQNAVDNTLALRLRDELRAGTLGPEDAEDIKAAIAALDQNETINRDLDRMGGGFSTAGAADREEWRQIRTQLAQALAVQKVGRRVTFDLRTNDKSYGEVETDEAGASSMEAFLDQLARDKRRAS
jgi:TP901 family phage tail tape measure protein